MSQTVRFRLNGALLALFTSFLSLSIPCNASAAASSKKSTLLEDSSNIQSEQNVCELLLSEARSSKEANLIQKYCSLIPADDMYETVCEYFEQHGLLCPLGQIGLYQTILVLHDRDGDGILSLEELREFIKAALPFGITRGLLLDYIDQLIRTARERNIPAELAPEDFKRILDSLCWNLRLPRRHPLCLR